jgi:hypothetical protein
MSDIKFACPHCRQHITCDADYGNAVIDCPSCGNGMVVPRLSGSDATHPPMFVVASTPTPKHHAPPAEPQLRAWTEQEWEAHVQDLDGAAGESAPLWALILLVTLIMVFVLRISHAGVWPMVVCLILGVSFSGVLLAKGGQSKGAYTLMKGFSFALAFCFLLPVVALGVLFIGCMACR